MIIIIVLIIIIQLLYAIIVIMRIVFGLLLMFSSCFLPSYQNFAAFNAYLRLLSVNNFVSTMFCFVLFSLLPALHTRYVGVDGGGGKVNSVT